MSPTPADPAERDAEEILERALDADVLSSEQKQQLADALSSGAPYACARCGTHGVHIPYT